MSRMSRIGPAWDLIYDQLDPVHHGPNKFEVCYCRDAKDTFENVKNMNRCFCLLIKDC